MVHDAFLKDGENIVIELSKYAFTHTLYFPRWEASSSVFRDQCLRLLNPTVRHQGEGHVPMCMESEAVVDTSLEMQVTNVEYDIAKSCRESVIATFGTNGTNGDCDEVLKVLRDVLSERFTSKDHPAHKHKTYQRIFLSQNCYGRKSS